MLGSVKWISTIPLGSRSRSLTNQLRVAAIENECIGNASLTSTYAAMLQQSRNPFMKCHEFSHVFSVSKHHKVITELISERQIYFVLRIASKNGMLPHRNGTYYTGSIQTLTQIDWRLFNRSTGLPQKYTPKMIINDELKESPCSPSTHAPKNPPLKEDVWVERKVNCTSTGKWRSYFQSVRTGTCAWDEPPSGASHVVYANMVSCYPQLALYVSVEEQLPIKSKQSRWLTTWRRKGIIFWIVNL